MADATGTCHGDMRAVGRTERPLGGLLLNQDISPPSLCFSPSQTHYFRFPRPTGRCADPVPGKGASPRARASRWSASRRCHLVNPLLLVHVRCHPGSSLWMGVGLGGAERVGALQAAGTWHTSLQPDPAPGAGDICHQLLHTRPFSGDPGKAETEAL